MADWPTENEQVLKAMKAKDAALMRKLIQDLNVDVNLPHTYRDGHFTFLFHAMIDNYLDGFEVLLDAGANPAWINRSHNSVLNLIIKRNQVRFFQACLKRLDKDQARAFVNQSTHNGWSVLMVAANGCAVEMSAELVANGADVNHSMETGWTAMHAAAKVGNVKTLEMLLSKGGDKNLQASHREFGKNLKVADVTSDPKMLEVLDKHN